MATSCEAPYAFRLMNRFVVMPVRKFSEFAKGYPFAYSTVAVSVMVSLPQLLASNW
jgi:hypothetical protein